MNEFHVKFENRRKMPQLATLQIGAFWCTIPYLQYQQQSPTRRVDRQVFDPIINVPSTKTHDRNPTVDDDLIINENRREDKKDGTNKQVDQDADAAAAVEEEVAFGGHCHKSKPS